MKSTKLSALVLALSIAATAMAIPAAAAFNSTGEVVFSEKGTTPPVKPENPDQPQQPPEVDETGQTGNLTLDVIPSFEFGKHPIPTVDTTIASKIKAGIHSNAVAVADAQTFVQVTDVRPTSDGWNVLLVASAFRNGGNEISGARLELDAGSVAGPDSANEPVAYQANLMCTDVALDQTHIKILNADAGKGIGTWVSRMYPTPWDGSLNIGDDNTKARLFVPGNSGVKQMAYTCNLTWTLSATP